MLNTWGNYNPTGTIRIYNNIFAAGPHTYRASSFYENPGNVDSYLDFRRNLYWDNNYGWGNMNRDGEGMLGNPQFTSPDTSDLTLTAASPALNNGNQAIPMTVSDDFTRLDSRPQGGTSDLGA